MSSTASHQRDGLVVGQHDEATERGEDRCEQTVLQGGALTEAAAELGQGQPRAPRSAGRVNSKARIKAACSAPASTPWKQSAASSIRAAPCRARGHGEHGMDRPQRDHGPAAAVRRWPDRRRRAGSSTPAPRCRDRGLRGPDEAGVPGLARGVSVAAWAARCARDEATALAGEVGDALEAVGDLGVRAERGLRRVPRLQLDERMVCGRHQRPMHAPPVGSGRGVVDRRLHERMPELDRSVQRHQPRELGALAQDVPDPELLGRRPDEVDVAGESAAATSSHCWRSGSRCRTRRR